MSAKKHGDKGEALREKLEARGSHLTRQRAAVFDYLGTDHHYHTRCLECGKIWDLDVRAGAELLQQIKPQAGFAVKDYRLELLGYCRDCRR